ncbi:copper-binding transcription factor [Coemansia sp. RSA 1813]|nr:copper-binding transcription factor [Coemansia sp. RSA 1646]KAJ1771764.1 copper-binding transcription factor [Coemansia sp. RSA 1843]KAJ2093411.1 copper-binding transcription factor [Coemansia sp. RSA 986]KAJ2217218.1 copper-binding transcription factor [Coemansia sp. RSA 487]KAJ2572417.1 copper-binding transcription factor [Coemansia sp. RSA 1813]
MIIKEGKKFACFSCIRGHRASSCSHVERELREIRRKGRPVTQCVKCRELRKTRKAHVKCLCKELKDNSLSIISPQSAMVESPAPKYRRLDDDDEGATRKVSSIDNLLNPCQCSGLNACKCCQPALTDFLHKSYPREVVEEAANAVRDQLNQTNQQQNGIQTHSSSSESTVINEVFTNSARTNGSAIRCPSGPNAACCKPDDGKKTPVSARPTLPILKAAAMAMQQSRPQPHQIHSATTHNPATANRPVTLPARNIHGLRLTHQPAANGYSRLPSIRNYKEPATTIPAIGGNSTLKHGSPHRSHHSQNSGHSIMDRPKCGCGCDCDEKVALLVQKIEERLGLPVKTSGIASAHINGESASEWVERILSPVVSAMHPPSLPSFPSLPSRFAGNGVSASTARPMTSTHPAPAPRPAPISTVTNDDRGEMDAMARPLARKISGTYSEPHSARNRSFSTSGSSISISNTSSRRTSFDVMSPLMQQRRSSQDAARQNARAEFAAGIVPPIMPPNTVTRNSGGCCSSTDKPIGASNTATNSHQQGPGSASATSSCCPTTTILPQQVLPVRTCCDPPAQSKITVPEPRRFLQPAPVLRRVSSGQPVLTSTASLLRSQEPPKPSALALQPPTAVPTKRTASMQSLPAISLSTPTTATVDKPSKSNSGCGSCGDKCSCCNKNRRWKPVSQENPLVDEDGALACSCGCHKPFQECSDCVTDLCEGLLLKEAPL